VANAARAARAETAASAATSAAARAAGTTAARATARIEVAMMVATQRATRTSTQCSRATGLTAQVGAVALLVFVDASVAAPKLTKAERVIGLISR
jgi:hypothetical protein